MIMKLLKQLNQSSTWRGLALLASAAAASAGYGHLLSVEVTGSGVGFGGAIGIAIPTIIGLYDTMRDEFKDKE